MRKFNTWGKMMKKIAVSAVAAASIVVTANAYEFKPMGYKATAMGGAGVASARGAYATYYNPALLASSDYGSEFAFGVGLSFGENDVADPIDELSDLNFSEEMDDIANAIEYDSDDVPASPNLARAQQIIQGIDKSNGLQLSPALSLGAQLPYNLGIGLYASADIRASMVIDQDRTDLFFEYNEGTKYASYNPSTGDVNTTLGEDDYKASSLEYAIEEGTTYLDAVATVTYELPIGYAHMFETQYGLLSVGGNIKPMRVDSFATQLKLDTESDDIADELDQTSKSSTAVTLDLGLLFTEKNTGIDFGLVGKNLTSPSFDRGGEQGGKIKYDAAYRAGLGYRMFNDRLSLAFDIDLNEQDTSFDGLSSQYVGGGVEFAPTSWLALRGGMMKNIASDSIDEGLIYSAGFGAGSKWLQVDLAGMVSSKSGSFDGSSIPRYASVNLSLVSRWW